MDSFQQELIERKLDLVSKASVVSKIAPEQKSEDLVDLLGKLNIKPCAGQKLDQMLDFDCVEVRFMTTPADTEESLPNKDTSDKDENFLEKYLREGTMEECHTQEQPNLLDQLLNSDLVMPSHTDDKPTPTPDNSTVNSVLLGENPIDTMIRGKVILDAVKDSIGDMGDILPGTASQEEVTTQDLFATQMTPELTHVPPTTTYESYPVSVSLENMISPQPNVDVMTQQFEMQTLMSPIPTTVYSETTVANSQMYVAANYSPQSVVTTSFVAMENISPPAQTLPSEQAAPEPEKSDTLNMSANQPILRGLMSSRKRTNPGGKGKVREQPQKKMVVVNTEAPTKTTQTNNVASLSTACVPEVVTEVQQAPPSLHQLLTSFAPMATETPQIPNFGSLLDDEEDDDTNPPMKRQKFE